MPKMHSTKFVSHSVDYVHHNQESYVMPRFVCLHAGLEFSILESWFRDVSRRYFQSVGLEDKNFSLDRGLESLSFHCLWNWSHAVNWIKL